MQSMMNKMIKTRKFIKKNVTLLEDMNKNKNAIGSKNKNSYSIVRKIILIPKNVK